MSNIEWSKMQQPNKADSAQDVSFAPGQLRASKHSAPEDQELYDPWGADPDRDYSIPQAVTRAEEDNAEYGELTDPKLLQRKVQSRDGQASSGGRGGMLPPGASVGGVSGQAAAPGVNPAAMGAGGPLSGGPVSLSSLQASQQAKMATPAVYSPPAGSMGGLTAASGGKMYDAEALRAELGQGGHIGGASSLPGLYVGPDGQVRNLPPGGLAGSTEVLPPGMSMGAGAAGLGAYGSGGPAGAAPGLAPGASNWMRPGSGAPHAAGSWNDSSYGGGWSQRLSGSETHVSSGGISTGLGAGAGGGSISTASSTDFTVGTGDVRNHGRGWDSVAEQQDPILKAILSSPPPDALFGVMNVPKSPYRTVVAESADHVEKTQEGAEQTSENMFANANNYDEQEEAATATAQGSGQ